MTKLFEKRYHESINKQNIAAVPTEASAHVCFVNVTRLGLIKDTTILYDRPIHNCVASGHGTAIENINFSWCKLILTIY